MLFVVVEFENHRQVTVQNMQDILQYEELWLHVLPEQQFIVQDIHYLNTKKPQNKHNFCQC